MIYAERGNKVIAIKESMIQKYVEQGYTITDDAGRVIKETVPTDIASLKKAYVDHTEEIKSLKAEIEKLNATISELKNAKPIEKEIAKDVEVEETPKRTRKSTKAE